ncbi:unnamed protein product [Effrenium voratum]|uniref:Epoxide hydrolase n=1 Tax=Effrenium voratum TaxID=2562239 RepID=A0AA36MVM5_9DINO|nr:unnamed protein product [Effrenium voratum]
MPHRVVIFDIGGVVIDSPINAIRDFCQKRQIQDLNRFLFSSQAWAALERGRLDWKDFPEAVLRECQEQGHDGAQLGLEGWQALQLAIVEGGGAPRPAMLHAIDRLRQSGFTVAALTNNFAEGSAALGRLPLLFDHFIESSASGMRKPEPRFYEHALRVIGCEPNEAIFLDDIGKNLKPAAEMGIFTIHVQNSHSEQHLEALRKLQGVVGLHLLPSKL